jgi:hypothetical protein
VFLTNIILVFSFYLGAGRYVVMDEAQRIKNERTLVGKAVRRLKTSGKLLLTGTPLQNTLRELWALLNFLFPDVLKEATGFEGDGSGPTGWGAGPASEESVAAARELLEPLMLRRTKKSVGLAIPPKREIRILAALSPTQYECTEIALLGLRLLLFLVSIHCLPLPAFPCPPYSMVVGIERCVCGWLGVRSTCLSAPALSHS